MLSTSDISIEKVLQTSHYQLIQDTTDEGNPCNYLIVPLSYQQDLLAVLTIYQCGGDRPWQDEDIQLIAGVAEQAALALSQAKLYQHLQEKQEQIRAELEVARQIQHNLLRQSLPEIKGAKVTSLLLSCS